MEKKVEVGGQNLRLKLEEFYGEKVGLGWILGVFQSPANRNVFAAVGFRYFFWVVNCCG